MFFHFLIPLPHGQGHFALAHKCANHLIAGIQIFLHAQQNFLKIRSTSAKSGGTKQKNLFVLYGFQQFQGGGICRTLIGPKADKQYRRRRHTALVISKIVAARCRQRLRNGLRQYFCVAGLTAE